MKLKLTMNGGEARRLLAGRDLGQAAAQRPGGAGTAAPQSLPQRAMPKPGSTGNVRTMTGSPRLPVWKWGKSGGVKRTNR